MNNQIVGRGLLAKSFSSVNASNCLFFCSGVSDSSETKVEAFERERQLLISFIKEANDNKLCFVYFSSVAATSVDSKYLNHKINMENIIETYCQKYLIFRLPQVAGPVFNTTLLPTMIKNIYQNQNFKVFKYARRTMVDVEDVVRIFERIILISLGNKVINICPSYSFYPEELVVLISEYLNKQPNYELIQIGSEQPCLLDNSVESKIVGSYFYKSKESYLKDIISKYTPQIIKLLEEA